MRFSIRGSIRCPRRESRLVVQLVPLVTKDCLLVLIRRYTLGLHQYLPSPR